MSVLNKLIAFVYTIFVIIVAILIRITILWERVTERFKSTDDKQSHNEVATSSESKTRGSD
jgi:hypothetical protein